MSTPSSTYRSEALRLTFLWLVCIPLWLTLGCSGGTVHSFGDYAGYAVAPADSKSAADKKWAAYLTTHLTRRAGERVVVVALKNNDETGESDELPEDFLAVNVGVAKDLSHDYAVTCSDGSLTLQARDASTLLWLIYQFMSAAGAHDARLSTSDLLPAAVRCTADTAGNFAFEYRGLYTPTNADEELRPILATHHVDYDWALWGHNLRKVFGGTIPDDARALIDGQRSDAQFCFSSASLYAALEAYVLNNYGEGSATAKNGEKADETARFAILPDDNTQVCQCEACRAAGNTATSATPAVTKLVSRLARRFPAHLFFTSAYATTTEAPAQPLPDNVGVLLSALSVPYSASPAKAAARVGFADLLADWQRVTSRIYVWDYVRNFDDYLTPYPCLQLLQQRLQYYADEGVRGVFLNGSGDDYAAFDDVQTRVMAALMVNPYQSLADYTAACWSQLYPVTAEVLAPYYESLENRAAKGELQPYAGISAAGSYLDPAAFETFWNSLDRAAKSVSGDERTRLNRLLTALCFTRLELTRLQADKFNRAQIAEILAGLDGFTAFSDMHHYREADGELAAYVGQWRSLLAWGKAEGNLLAGVQLRAVSALDEGYTDVTLLTDQWHGFPSDYHTGWLICSADTLTLEVPASAVVAAGTFRFGFLLAPKWHIALPSAVEVWQNGHCVARVSVDANPDVEPFTRHVVACPFYGLTPGCPVSLRLVREHVPRITLACDEVELSVE